jgi:hypothetical protein
MPQNLPSLRFVGAAVLASTIAALLLSYQWGHAAEPPLVKVTPASPEMMQLLRDEHSSVANMLKLQITNENKELGSGNTHRY